jgi:putative transposase
VLHQLIEAELTATIGAGPRERTETRTAMRNGHCPELVSTPAGDLELEIPKPTEGSFSPRSSSVAGGSTGRSTPS